jgi:hypothetical protein
VNELKRGLNKLSEKRKVKSCVIHITFHLKKGPLSIFYKKEAALCEHKTAVHYEKGSTLTLLLYMVYYFFLLATAGPVILTAGGNHCSCNTLLLGQYRRIMRLKLSPDGGEGNQLCRISTSVGGVF